MTTTQELIARMRGFGIFGEANALLREGAASIESLSAEVERLESDVLVQKGMARLARGECDQLRAQLEAQGEAVEPVAWRGRPLADEDWVLYWSKPHSVEVLEPLYTHPAPAAPVVQADEPEAQVVDLDADLFWWDEDPEVGAEDIQSIIDNLGPPIGGVVKIMQAKRLPTVEVEVIDEGDGCIGWKYVDAALHPTQPKGE